MQGTKHPAGWYKLTNLKRLWNGLRTGKAPGMVCHSSDPGSTEYGNTKTIPETSEKRECGGALQLLYTEFDVLNKTHNIREYASGRVSPLTKGAIAGIVSRKIFGSLPEVIPCDDVGLPWKQEKEL